MYCNCNVGLVEECEAMFISVGIVMVIDSGFGFGELSKIR